MSMLRSLPLIALLSFVSPSSQTPSFRGDRICEDFLEKWDKKPTELHFTDCERVEHEQIDRFVASYVVKGAEAEAVETYLKEEFNLTSLRFICCGWDSLNIDGLSGPSNGLYRDRFGNQFDVNMYSGETLIQDRGQWEKIPKFYVRITTYLGEP
ncbi:MAG: DUF4952 domain-containing protein [Cyanobacteria bacterium J06656_5]